MLRAAIHLPFKFIVRIFILYMEAIDFFVKMSIIVRRNRVFLLCRQQELPGKTDET